MASKAKDMDMDRECYRFCKQLGHWEKDCPEKKKAGDTVKTYQEWAQGDCDYYAEDDKLGTYGEIYQWLEEINPEDTLYPLDDIPPPCGEEEQHLDSLN